MGGICTWEEGIWEGGASGRGASGREASGRRVSGEGFVLIFSYLQFFYFLRGSMWEWGHLGGRASGRGASEKRTSGRAMEIPALPAFLDEEDDPSISAMDIPELDSEHKSIDSGCDNHIELSPQLESHIIGAIVVIQFVLINSEKRRVRHLESVLDEATEDLFHANEALGLNR